MLMGYRSLHRDVSSLKTDRRLILSTRKTFKALRVAIMRSCAFMCFIDLGQTLKRGFLFLKYVSEYMYTLHFMIVLINKISGSERDLIWFKKARDFIPFTTLRFVSLHFPQRLFHNTGQQHLHTGVSTLDRLSLSYAAVILVHKSLLWYCAIVAALWSCLSCKHSNPAYAST